MPTGYTSKLYDGEQDFPEFALTAARAFGALVTMRDAAFDAPIPDEFLPSPYHQDKLDEAIRRLAEVRVLSADECRRRAAAGYERWAADAREATAERDARLRRYAAMRERVLAWHPPTEDHVGLRDFMVEQLNTSIEFDCSPWTSQPPTLDADEWRAEQIASAEHDITYHERALAEERKRAADRTAWIRALRASLAEPAGVR